MKEVHHINIYSKYKLLISLIRTQVKSKITFKSFFSLDHHLRFKPELRVINLQKIDLNYYNTDWSILCLLSSNWKKQAPYWKQPTKILPLVAWHPVSSVCLSHQTERWWLWWLSPVSQSGCGGTGYWPAWQDHLCNMIGLMKVWYCGLIFIHWKPILQISFP